MYHWHRGGTPEVGFDLFELVASHTGRSWHRLLSVWRSEKWNTLDGKPSFE